MDASVEAKRVVISKKTNQGRHSQVDRQLDYYPTPAPLVRTLIANYPGSLDGPLWEPAAGRGDLARPLLEAGYAVTQTDIEDYGTGNLHEVGDFFAFKQPPGGIKTIITNPPFHAANRFIRHGLSLCDTVIILQRLVFLEGRGRSDILNDHLDHVICLIERPPMMHRWTRGPDGIWREWAGKKASSAMPFAWFVFHAHKTKPTTLHRASWRIHSPRVRAS